MLFSTIKWDFKKIIWLVIDMNFLIEYLKNPGRIGAVAPSGNALARKMIKPINFKSADV